MSLACLCSWAHLGLAGGHVVLMAQGWQDCLTDKGIIHFAPSLYYNNAITALGSWPELLYHCFLLYFWVSIVPSRTNVGKQSLHCNQKEGLCRPFAPGPLLPTDLLEQETCALTGQERVSLPRNQRVSSQQFCRWSMGVSLKVQITFWTVAPGTGLYQQVRVCTRGERKKKSSIKHTVQNMVQHGVRCSSCAGRCVSRGVIVYWLWILWGVQ